jgi:hypothetical protein
MFIIFTIYMYLLADRVYQTQKIDCNTYKCKYCNAIIQYILIYYVTPLSLLRKYYNLLRNSFVVTPQILQKSVHILRYKK